VLIKPVCNFASNKNNRPQQRKLLEEDPLHQKPPNRISVRDLLPKTISYLKIPTT